MRTRSDDLRHEISPVYGPVADQLTRLIDRFVRHQQTTATILSRSPCLALFDARHVAVARAPTNAHIYISRLATLPNTFLAAPRQALRQCGNALLSDPVTDH
jgi:hypothetical protein